MRVRTRRQGRANAVVPVDILQNADLSANARFLYALLMSYPDDWQFNRAHLGKVTGFGRDKLTNALGELRTIGLVKTVVTHDDEGGFSGSTWIIFDEPQDEAVKGEIRRPSETRCPENPSTEERHPRCPENPSTEKAASGKSAPLKDRISNQIESEPPQPPAPSPQPCASPPADRVPGLLAQLRSMWPSDRDRAPKRAERELRAALAAGAEPARILAEARSYLEAEKGRERGRFIRPLFAWLNAADLTPPVPGPARPATIDGLARMFGERIEAGAFVSPSAFSAEIGRRIVELGLADAARLRSLGLPS